MLVLTMEFDQTCSSVSQRTDRHHAPIDPRPRSTLHGHRTGQDDLVITIDGTEPSFHYCFARPRTDHRRIRSSAEEQTQSADEQRLAGPGLPSKRRRSRCQHQRRVVDHAEVANPEFNEHVCHFCR